MIENSLGGGAKSAVSNAEVLKTLEWIKQKLSDAGVTPSRYVVEKGQTRSAWYAVYNDGWIEQGSILKTSEGDETVNKSFTFPRSFSNTSYSLYNVGFMISPYGRQIVTKRTTGFTTTSDTNNCATAGWYACGY